MTRRFDVSENVPVLRTARLILRPWRDADLESFAALNADPAVMEHFPATLSRAESDAAAARIRAELSERGFGLWAVEAPGVAPFVGFTGLSVVRFDAPFTRAAEQARAQAPRSGARSEAKPSEVIETGWRLACAYWGRGYAPEAARAALAFGFERLGLAEIVSFTAVGNVRSRRVMEKIGMAHDPAGDFEHPALPPGHRLRRHVLYRIRRG
jgi:RimJ/RimL family protein N-acetyltransferase